LLLLLELKKTPTPPTPNKKSKMSPTSDEKFQKFLTENILFFRQNTTEVDNVLLELVATRIISPDTRAIIVSY